MENEKTLVQYKGKLAINNGILKTLNNFELKVMKSIKVLQEEMKKI